MSNEIFIIKAGGEREAFQPEKLLRSLVQAGADEASAREVVAHVEKEIRDDMRTSDVYEHAFSELRRKEKPAAGRYSLKRALAEFGPTGFPFERFVAEIFKARGFATEHSIIGRGKCIEHELDVVAWKGEDTITMEAKFHHEQGLKSDVKVALYVKARFTDLIGMPVRCGGAERRITDGLLITNTKFTERAIQYSACAGVKLIGWNYPAQGNLHDLIQEAGVHPITSLSSFSATDKQHLMEAGIILCRDLRGQKEKIVALGIPSDRLTAALSESTRLCPL